MSLKINVIKIGAKTVTYLQPAYAFPRNVPPANVHAVPGFILELNRGNSQEIDNAKSKNDACRLGRDRCDGNGDIDRNWDDYARFGANNGEPGNREKYWPAMREMPYGPACA